jgi:hypothetical protein
MTAKDGLYELYRALKVFLSAFVGGNLRLQNELPNCYEIHRYNIVN